MEQSFDCKEGCGEKVLYVPKKVVVYRGFGEKTSPPATGQVIRVYLECPKKHVHEYAVRT